VKVNDLVLERDRRQHSRTTEHQRHARGASSRSSTCAPPATVDRLRPGGHEEDLRLIQRGSVGALRRLCSNTDPASALVGGARRTKGAGAPFSLTTDHANAAWVSIALPGVIAVARLRQTPVGDSGYLSGVIITLSGVRS
jgi:hypothetical protein